MSESTELSVELCQNASNNDYVKNVVQIATNGDLSCDQNSVQIDVCLIRPDVDNCVESKSKTIESSDRSEKSGSETELDISGSNGTTGMTRVSQLNGVDGMRNIHTNSTTQAPDVCSGSQHRDTYDGVDGMREEPSQDSLKAHISSASISALPDNSNEVLIIETVVKTNSNEVTLITDTTVKTTSHSSDQTLNQSSNDCSDDLTQETNNQNNNKKNKNKDSNAMTTTTTSRSKQLKSLLKRGPKEISINRNNEKRRVRFSETMQVFCDDWPQELMPQIIALKSPTDFNLVEVQGYMFEPPAEYQDFLPFEPPPDYRDFIANSLCAFDRDLSINYIDDEEDEHNSKAKMDQKFVNEFSSKWESMILDNSESLEEEQIIGVLKEDAILQAIGSHVSLPDEQLCPEDFPIHFQNKDNSYAKLADSELSDITSEDGNDSSPTGSLQDIQSDSSITSQDTIILMNSDSIDNNDSVDKTEVLSNKNCFNDIETPNDEEFNSLTISESVVSSQTETEDMSTKCDTLDDRLNNESNSETNESLVCEESNESNFESDLGNGVEAEVDSAPDVRQDIERREVQTSETHGSDSSPSNCEPNDEKTKQLNLLTNEETNDLQTNHSNAFKRNLMFYENMFSDKSIKSDVNSKADKPIKQSHTVTHFVIQNNSKFPIITQMISNFNNNNNNINNNSNNCNNNNENSVQQTNERSIEAKQQSNEPNGKTMNASNGQTLPAVPMRAALPPTQQTQPNPSNWSTDEFIIEYTSEPRALVPSKRTASLSNFATAQMTANPPVIPIRSNANNSNIQYLSLNRNGELPKQWNAYNIDPHNSSQQIRYQYPPNQRSLSPNPPMVSANTRPVSPQQVYYQNRAQTQYNPRFQTTKTMPVHVTYNRMAGPQHRVSIRPVMSQTLGRPHTQPPPYHYHIQQHNNEFPNPSEIRRRDGLNAYPHVLNQTPQAGALPVPPIHHNNQNHSPQTLSKDELEQFVQQDIQRTERIKKRYSMSEEDDPSFGFARRPSVRGIRPKFGTTNDILKQMQTPNNNCAIGSQMGGSAGSHVSWPQTTNSLPNNNNNNNNSNNQMSAQTQHKQSFQNKPQIVQLRHPMSVKQYVSEVSAPDPSHPSHGSTAQMSRTLPHPRPSSLITQSQMNAIRTEDGLVIRVLNTSRDQLKQQIQRQLEQQLQPKLKQKMTQMSNNVKPVVMSSNDERGAPEGASSSPKHSSDLLFAKNMNSCSNPNPNPHPNPCSGELTVNNKTTNRLQTNDTKRLVINEENTNPNSKLTDDSEGVIYYSMNV